jgi:hypothetical protein
MPRQVGAFTSRTWNATERFTLGGVSYQSRLLFQTFPCLLDVDEAARHASWASRSLSLRFWHGALEPSWAGLEAGSVCASARARRTGHESSRVPSDDTTRHDTTRVTAHRTGANRPS